MLHPKYGQNILRVYKVFGPRLFCEYHARRIIGAWEQEHLQQTAASKSAAGPKKRQVFLSSF